MASKRKRSAGSSPDPEEVQRYGLEGTQRYESAPYNLARDGKDAETHSPTDSSHTLSSPKSGNHSQSPSRGPQPGKEPSPTLDDQLDESLDREAMDRAKNSALPKPGEEEFWNYDYRKDVVPAEGSLDLVGNDEVRETRGILEEDLSVSGGDEEANEDVDSRSGTRALCTGTFGDPKDPALEEKHRREMEAAALLPLPDEDDDDEDGLAQPGGTGR